MYKFLDWLKIQDSHKLFIHRNQFEIHKPFPTKLEFPSKTLLSNAKA